MNDLKPAADEEPVSEVAAEMWRAALERDGIPVTPSRLRLRVDTGPVGYLWLEWLGACARVAGVCSPELAT